MELENKYVGSKYNSFCEYFCELTEFLDNITERKRYSLRHYILALSCDFADGVLPIRLPGSTVGGGCRVDNEKLITDNVYWPTHFTARRRPGRLWSPRCRRRLGPGNVKGPSRRLPPLPLCIGLAY